MVNIELNVTLMDTIDNVKAKIQEAEDPLQLPRRQMCLTFRGDRLADEFTLERCGIRDGDTLVLTLLAPLITPQVQVPPTASLAPEVQSMVANLKEAYEEVVRNLQEEVNRSRVDSRFQGKSRRDEDEDTLKPLHHKDFKMPGEYDGDSKEFPEWHARFLALLGSKNKHWRSLLRVVAEFGGNKVKDLPQLRAKLLEQEMFSVSESLVQYSDQLRTLLFSFTKGNLHARLLKETSSHSAFEVYRELVHKGKNANAHRMMALKASLFQTSRKSAGQLDSALLAWKHNQQEVTEFDGYRLDDEAQKLILLEMMPECHVEWMRDKWESTKDDYHAFESELLRRMDLRRMDEESKGARKPLNELGGGEPSEAPETDTPEEE